MDAFSRSGHNRKFSLFLSVASFILLAACQSGGNSAALDSTAAPASDAQQQSDEIENAALQTGAEAEPTPADGAVTEIAEQQTAQPGGQCTIQLTDGPPPKPPRGRDFGQAVAKNTGNAIKRGVIQQIGARVAGGLGAAVAGGVAQSTIRQEEDIKGVWMITDGRADCACEISVDSLWKLKGKGADSGFSKNRGCSNPEIQKVAAWTLGYSFTGYDSKFELKAKDKQTVLATLKRDGIHYFSGSLSNGTPVVMWRQGQTYQQLGAFNKSLK